MYSKSIITFHYPILYSSSEFILLVFGVGKLKILPKIWQNASAKVIPLQTLKTVYELQKHRKYRHNLIPLAAIINYYFFICFIDIGCETNTIDISRHKVQSKLLQKERIHIGIRFIQAEINHKRCRCHILNYKRKKETWTIENLQKIPINWMDESTEVASESACSLHRDKHEKEETRFLEHDYLSGTIHRGNRQRKFFQTCQVLEISVDNHNYHISSFFHMKGQN